MKHKTTKHKQNITPAGEVELNEEELDQVTGAAFAKYEGVDGECSKTKPQQTNTYKVEIEGLRDVRKQ